MATFAIGDVADAAITLKYGGKSLNLMAKMVTMAEIRLNKLIKQFNIGLDTLVDFLNSLGAGIKDANPNMKVSDEYLPALHKKFGKDREMVEAAAKVDVKLTEILEASKQRRRIEMDTNPTPTKVLVKKIENTPRAVIPTAIENYAFGDGTMTATVRSISFPNRIITGPVGEYEAGVLFPENITCDGAPIPYAWLTIYAKDFFEVGSEIRVSVKSAIKDGKVAILELPIDKAAAFTKALQDTKRYFETLAPGLRLESTYPIAETADYYFIGIQDTLMLGVILKQSIPVESIQEDGSIPIYVAEKGQSLLDLLICYCPVTEAQKEETSDLDKAVSAFLSEAEMDVILEEDLAIVKYILEKYPHVNRSNCDQFTGDIYCRVPSDSAMIPFLTRGGLKDRAFWMNCTRRADRSDGEPTIILFNESPTIAIEMVIKDGNQFQLKTFDSLGSYDTRAVIMRNNRQGSLLKVSPEHLHFVTSFEPIPTEYSTEAAIDLAEKLGDFNGRILGTIRKGQREKISRNAKDYETLNDYLEFKRDKEQDSVAAPVFIPAERIMRTAGENIGGPGGLKLELTPEILEALLPGEEDSIDGMHVSIVDETGLLEMMTGVLKSNGYDTILLFNRGHVNPDDFMDGGIYIRRRVNVKPLVVQMNALKDFVMMDSLGIYHELVGGRLKPVDERAAGNLEFFNPVFGQSSVDNNQPLAVRKALANENVVLIQGPPGTGKTTIIVEIIAQLVKQGRKVLVCSQAHAAVKNIYDRLPIDGMNVVNLDDEEAMNKLIREFSPEIYGRFLKNNIELIRHFALHEGSVEEVRALIGEFVYDTPEQTLRYRSMHHGVVDILMKKGFSQEKLEEALTKLEEETREITGMLLQTRLFQTRDVVMGTCMGIGMNRALSSRSVHFDTVIIDEAGKANLAETLVPMQLGDRFILVGDHRQLPPFIDRAEIMEYVEDAMEEGDKPVDATSVVAALSNSLFADFFNHPNFPEENKVMLNYQFRMNPEIGQYISDLFYEGKLFSGKGTEKQNLDVEGFPNAVTFVKTDTLPPFDPENDPRETAPGDGSYFNDREITLICNEILPVVQKAMDANPELKLGIITPYKAQYFRLRQRLEDTQMADYVHTIDSIQGSEFDIVIFSFVRSFSKSSGKTVGFLDDMRRLNVSLSRAKKKLILVGNLYTLQNPNAHANYGVSGMVQPVDVFKSIARNIVNYGSASDYEVFMESKPVPGMVFWSCPYECRESGQLVFQLERGGRKLHFSMPIPEDFPEGDSIDVVFVKQNEKTGKPMFRIADIEAFYEKHTVGDCLDGIVKHILPLPSGEKLYFIRVDGMDGALKMRPDAPDFAKVGDVVTVEVSGILLEERRLYLKPKLSIAEKLLDRNRSKYLFSASVNAYGEFPSLTLLMDDGSMAEVKAPFLYRVSVLGRKYDLFRMANMQVILDKRYYEAFRAHYKIDQFVNGTVVGEDEKFYYIDADDAFGVVFKRFMRGRTLSMGEKCYFKVYKFNDEFQHIVFNL